MNDPLFTLSQDYLRRARTILDECRIVESWQAIGADAHLVGSVRTELLMNHLDIDLHIYSDSLTPELSFAAVSRIASTPGIEQIDYRNLTQTDEHCIEWHAFYRDAQGDRWQIDMIHILRGSFYDGYFEQIADRITARLTPETRRAILQIKHDVPAGAHAAGIEICRAVLDDHVRDYAAFIAWQQADPSRDMMQWRP